MKTIKIDVGGVNITLTKEQLQSIDAQRNRKYTIDDITSYGAACEILGEEADEDASIDKIIKTIVKAGNFVDNGQKLWKADFTNSEDKFIPWLQKGGSGWFLVGVSSYYSSTHCPVGFYYKSRSTCNTLVSRFIKQYDEWAENEG